ncbi:MAG: hypothetical protein H6671_15610 [Anaerolineaceae bacterium]|nr:hypothetical protein [Anaerolineaceae bacterium]
MTQFELETLNTRTRLALAELESVQVISPYVDWNRTLPKPFHGSGDIRLVIIGQDPTVRLKSSRDQVNMVLDLDKKNSNLYRFLNKVCEALGLSLNEHVYATNAYKNFFTQPPTSIKQVNVLEFSAPVWLPVLQYELNSFPQAAVMSLGQPVLSMLVKSDHRQDRSVCYYWGHPSFPGAEQFKSVSAEESTVNRRIFPMVHLNTRNTNRFYHANETNYINYMKGFLKG